LFSTAALLSATALALPRRASALASRWRLALIRAAPALLLIILLSHRAALRLARALVGPRRLASSVLVGTTLACGRRLPSTIALTRRTDGDAKLAHGAAVDPPSRLQAVPTLELDQRLLRAWAEASVDFNREPSINQHALHFADFIRAEIDDNLRAAATADRRPAAAGRFDRDHGRDAAPIVNDDDLIAHDEVLMPAEFRTDFHDLWRNGHDPHARRNDGADRNAEVDAIDARHVGSGEHGIPDAGALVDGEIDATLR
jgi:hypothetical protein